MNQTAYLAAALSPRTPLALLLCASLVACGGGEPASSPSAPVDAADPAPSASPDTIDGVADDGTASDVEPDPPSPPAVDVPPAGTDVDPPPREGDEPDGNAAGDASVTPDDPAVPAVGDSTAVGYVSAVSTPGAFAAGPLPPLPVPPLSPAPGADDEPRPANGSRDTAVDFAAVEESRARPVDPFKRIDDAEFEAGAPPPVLTFPPDHDPTTNAPTFFEGLDNVTIVAGEEFELLLDPIDPDGGIAGQFAHSLPPGARYVDNFDTTRSLVWRPLEPDVGLTAFTVTTNDPLEPLLRNTYTILIRVVLPEDPSTIVNLGPGIDQVEPQTVRIGDPVVIEIKGTDPNGTVPTLELTGAPADATLVPHLEDPRISVLRFVPARVGTIEIDVLARDALDPALTHAKTVAIEVRPAEDFLIDGERLRTLAAERGLRIGFAAASGFEARADGALYADIAAREFGVVTAENAMKWDALNPLPGHYRWADADNLVAWARANDVLVHGHTLVWYTQLPTWIRESEPALREGHMREHIDRVMRRYGEDVPVWDVVNEALEDDGTLRDSVWHQAMGPAYIDIAYRQARATAPGATLLYNETGIAEAGPKAEGLHRLLGEMQAAGTPLDGVGFQVHVTARFDQFDELAENLRRVAARGLELWITELDVSMDGDDTEAMQAEVYERVLDVCLAQPACKVVQMWGFTDRYSWRAPRTPLILDREYQPKPSYRALQRRLGER